MECIIKQEHTLFPQSLIWATLQAIILFLLRLWNRFYFYKIITTEVSDECFPAAVSFSLVQNTLHIHRAAY